MPNYALVIIDLQKEFVTLGQPAGIASRKKGFCVENARRLLGYAHEQKWPVIHVGTRHSDFSSLPPHKRRRGDMIYCLAVTA
jgi:nicotinamidase-related amidase